MKSEYFFRDTIKVYSLDIIDEANILSGRRKELQFDIKNTALLVLDMQNYFTEESSNAFVPSINSIIPNINALISYFSSEDSPVIYTKHINNDDNAIMMKRWWKRLLDHDNPMSGLSPKITIASNSMIISKPQYDAFHQTELNQILKDKQISSLIITGAMTNLCCESTARSAFINGYSSILPVDATAAYNLEYHRATCLNLALGFSDLCMTDDLIKKI